MNALQEAKEALGHALEHIHESEQLLSAEEMTDLRERLSSSTEENIGELQEEIRGRIAQLSGSEWSTAIQTYNMVLEANLNPFI